MIRSIVEASKTTKVRGGADVTYVSSGGLDPEGAWASVSIERAKRALTSIERLIPKNAMGNEWVDEGDGEYALTVYFKRSEDAKELARTFSTKLFKKYGDRLFVSWGS